MRANKAVEHYAAKRGKVHRRRQLGDRFIKEPLITTEQFHTYCAMCISCCGVVATVEDGRLT